MNDDRYFMSLAVAEARIAISESERPFGCVIVCEDRVIATGRGTGSDLDPTRHSEMVAIRQACEHLETADLSSCILYSTHEPCTMCAGAIVHAHVGRVVWGSDRDHLPMLFRKREFGGARTVFYDCSKPPEFESHVLEDECVRLFDDEVRAFNEIGRDRFGGYCG